jgi:hypothetical protein
MITNKFELDRTDKELNNESNPIRKMGYIQNDYNMAAAAPQLLPLCDG